MLFMLNVNEYFISVVNISKMGDLVVFCIVNLFVEIFVVTIKINKS